MPRPGPAVYIALEKGVIDADGNAAHANDHANGLRMLTKPPIFPGIDAAPILRFTVSRMGWDAMTPAERTILRVRYVAAYGDMRRIPARRTESWSPAPAPQGCRRSSTGPRGQARQVPPNRGRWVGGDLSPCLRRTDHLGVRGDVGAVRRGLGAFGGVRPYKPARYRRHRCSTPTPDPGAAPDMRGQSLGVISLAMVILLIVSANAAIASGPEPAAPVGLDAFMGWIAIVFITAPVAMTLAPEFGSGPRSRSGSASCRR